MCGSVQTETVEGTGVGVALSYGEVYVELNTPEGQATPGYGENYAWSRMSLEKAAELHTLLGKVISNAGLSENERLQKLLKMASDDIDVLYNENERLFMENEKLRDRLSVDS